MSLKLLSIAIVTLASALTLVFSTVVLLAAWRRHREHQSAQALPQARTQMHDLLDHATASSEEIQALSCLPARVQVTVFAELAVVLSGSHGDRLSLLARLIGLTEGAKAQCHSRLWWRRLQGVRLLSLLGGGAQQIPNLLDDPNTEVRAAAAVWSASNQAHDTPTQLIKLLSDEQPLVRFAAQGALLTLGRATVEPLALGLRNPRPGQLEAALQVAVGLADRRLLAPAFLHAEDPDRSIRVFIAELAGAIGGERATAMLTNMLDDNAAEVRAAAARGLGRLGHWPAGPQLLRALADRAWIVRQRAGIALRSLGAPGLLLLRSGLHDDDKFARDMARQVLDLPDTDERPVYT